MTNLFNVDAASFVTGVPMSTDTGWVVMAMDNLAEQEIEHSAILKYNQGVFESVCLKMFRSKYVAWLTNLEEAVFVGDNGECAVVGVDSIVRDEYVTSSSRSPRNTGHIRGAAAIGDDVIVVGMQRQVYRRTGVSGWVDMMQGIPPSDSAGITGFECVLAVSPDEIYAAGWRGELWMFDGTRWNRLDSPTNGIITSLCLDENGEIIGCGRKGLFIRGRGDKWRVIEGLICPDDLWSVISISGRIYAAGLRFLYALSDDKIEIIDFENIRASTFGSLVSGGGVLWSMGEKDLLSFNGSNWKRL